MNLKRQKHKPGSVVQRFGDWRKKEPTVLIDNQYWADIGKPEIAYIEFPPNFKNIESKEAA